MNEAETLKRLDEFAKGKFDEYERLVDSEEWQHSERNSAIVAFPISAIIGHIFKEQMEEKVRERHSMEYYSGEDWNALPEAVREKIVKHYNDVERARKFIETEHHLLRPEMDVEIAGKKIPGIIRSTEMNSTLEHAKAALVAKCVSEGALALFHTGRIVEPGQLLMKLDGIEEAVKRFFDAVQKTKYHKAINLTLIDFAGSVVNPEIYRNEQEDRAIREWYLKPRGPGKSSATLALAKEWQARYAEHR